MRRSSISQGPGLARGPVGIVLAGLAAFVMSPPVTAEAQVPAPVSEGTTSLSFGIDGNGSGEAGIWLFISDRTNLGLLGRLDWVSEERNPPRSDRTELTFGIGPRVKWYLMGSPRVAPFWFGGFDVTHTRRSEDDEDRTSRGIGFDGGFGVDWFPVDQMSVGGWTGLRISSDRAENEDTTSRIRTLTTGLRVHIYF